MPVRKNVSALTLVEALVILVLLAVLMTIFIPAVSDRGVASRGMSGALANARSLYQATTMMALESQEGEGARPRGAHMHWTTMHSDGKAVPTTAAMYFTALTKNGYLTEEELKKLLTTPGRGPGQDAPTAQNSGFKFFVVDDASPSDQPLVVTANWKDRQLTDDAPYGKKGFVYFSKGGDGGAKTRPADVASTNIFPVSNGKDVYRTDTLE